MANLFLMPQFIYSGEGALEMATSTIKDCGKHALIVTDTTMEKLGNTKTLIKLLEKINIDYTIFNGINSEPNDQMISEGCQMYNENNCDFLIALGGGSPIDSMKAIAYMHNESSAISTFVGKEMHKELPVMIAIPTTAGTGSEATKFTIITDTKSDIKMLLKGACLIPTIAIIDPAFTLSVPKTITSATGIDALTHAIEAYTSKLANPLSNTMALSAIKRIFNNLETCYQDGNNVEARIQMSLAALEAGIAFNNASVTIVHGMSRPIGALFHVPHGISNAILLYDCLAFIIDGARDQFIEIAKHLNINGANDQEIIENFLSKLKQLLVALEIPTVSQLKIDQQAYLNAIPKMAIDAYNSGSPANTRKSITIADMENIYRNLYK